MGNASSKDIRDILITEGITTPIYIGQEPAEPTEVITLYDLPGQEPNPKWKIDYPDLQVRGRSQSYEDAYSFMNEVKNLLLGRAPATIGTYYYTSILGKNDINFIGKDEKNRSIFTWTIAIVREPTDSSNRKPLS